MPTQHQQHDSSGLRRRDFLKNGAAVGIAGAAATSGSAHAYTLTLASLNEHEGRTLLRMSRQLYPHESLGDQYYGAVVIDIDDAAGEDADLVALVKNGVAALDAATGVRWVDLSDGYQLRVLREQLDTPFVQTVKGKTLVGLYNNPLVWRHFGYEGEAFSKGGYLGRGFNDLNWLPDPPEEASPGLD